MLLSSMKVLVLEDRQSLSLSLSLDHGTKSLSLSSNHKSLIRPIVFVLETQSPRKLSRTSHYANSLLCMISWSNSVTATVHEVTVKNALLTDIIYTVAHRRFVVSVKCASIITKNAADGNQLMHFKAV